MEKAESLNYFSNGKSIEVKTNKEIILSAGAVFNGT